MTSGEWRVASGEWRVRKEEERFLPAQADRPDRNRGGKKTSACSVRSRKIIRDANDANDGRWGPFVGVAREDTIHSATLRTRKGAALKGRLYKGSLRRAAPGRGYQRRGKRRERVRRQ